MTNSLQFELVLPCYNEANNLPHLVNQIANAADKSGVQPGEFEVVLVDNGSLDHSFAVMEDLKRGPYAKWFRIYRIPKNQGYGYGLYEALKTTSAPIVGWSHADLQCDPAYALEAYKIVKSNAEPILVKGHRFGRNWKDWTVSRFFEFISFFICGSKVREINAQPKVFKRELLFEISNPPVDFAFDLYVLFIAQKKNWKIQSIRVLFPARVHGASNWAAHFLMRYKTIFKMIGYMFKLAYKEGRR